MPSHIGSKSYIVLELVSEFFHKSWGLRHVFQTLHSSGMSCVGDSLLVARCYARGGLTE